MEYDYYPIIFHMVKKIDTDFKTTSIGVLEESVSLIQIIVDIFYKLAPNLD